MKKSLETGLSEVEVESKNETSRSGKFFSSSSIERMTASVTNTQLCTGANAVPLVRTESMTSTGEARDNLSTLSMKLAKNTPTVSRKGSCQFAFEDLVKNGIDNDPRQCLSESHGDEDCSPQLRYKLRLNTDDGSATCRAKEGSCKQNLCKCDTQFAQRVSEVYASSYAAENKNFDRSQCIQGPGGQEKQCCGSKDTFPLNRPYRISSQCCDSSTAKIYEIGSDQCM